MSKPILSVDFDGVIHSYTSKWAGADVIPDPPVPGALEFLRAATEHFRVCIFSTRSHQPGGIEAMQDWLFHYTVNDQDESDGGWRHLIEFPTTKPPALVSIDDRAFLFEGTFPDLATLRAFKPWNKRG